mgnify:CR=1 FL=1
MAQEEWYVESSEDIVEQEFFKTEEEAISHKEHIEGHYRRVRVYVKPISFKDMKEIITVEQFEELFGITITEPVE